MSVMGWFAVVASNGVASELIMRSNNAPSFLQRVCDLLEIELECESVPNTADTLKGLSIIMSHDQQNVHTSAYK